MFLVTRNWTEVANRLSWRIPLPSDQHDLDPLAAANKVVFGMEKLEWCRYPTVKNFEDIFIRFGATHERDRQTDGRTPRAGISRLCIASRGKKTLLDVLYC